MPLVLGAGRPRVARLVASALFSPASRIASGRFRAARRPYSRPPHRCSRHVLDRVGPDFSAAARGDMAAAFSWPGIAAASRSVASPAAAMPML